MGKLDGKTALITGGTSGIGLATARLFMEEGAQVAISGQDEGRLREAAEGLGLDALTIRADMRSLADIEGMVEEVRDRFGELDILFVNAGVVLPASFNQVDEANFEEQMTINLKGPFFTIQKATPLLREGSSVLLTTTAFDERGLPGMSVYAASKAALRSLSRTFAAELVACGVRVNAVSPGPTETPIYSKLGMPPEAVQQMAQQLNERVPMHRFGQPEEVVRAALFLASTDSSFVLGHELVIDGGFNEL